MFAKRVGVPGVIASLFLAVACGEGSSGESAPPVGQDASAGGTGAQAGSSGQAGSAGSTAGSSAGGSAGDAGGAAGMGGAAGADDAGDGAVPDAEPPCTGPNCPAIWAGVWGDGTADQYARGIASDATGSAWLVGEFRGALKIGDLEPLASAGLGTSDGFIAKLDFDGKPLWSIQFGDAQDQGCAAVAVAPTGDISIAGSYLGSLVLKPPSGVGGLSMPAAGLNTRGLIARLDKDGAPAWGKSISLSGADIKLSSVAVDLAGSTIAAGYSDDLGQANDKDVYVLRFDPSGTHQWTFKNEDPLDQKASTVAADKTGSVWVTGSFDTKLTPTPPCGDLAGAGLDAFVLRLSTTGACLLAKGWGDAAEQVGEGLAVDSTGAGILCGSFHGTIDFGLGVLTAPANAYALYVVRLGSDGVPVWASSFGSSSSRYSCTVATDSKDNAIVTGSFSGTADFGSGPLVSLGARSTFLTKFDVAGKLVWSRMIGAADASVIGQVSSGVATHAATQRIYLGGFGDGTFTFGSGTIPSAGMADVFVAAFQP